MKGNQRISLLQRKFFRITSAVFLLMVSGSTFAQSDLVVNGTLTIPLGTVVTVNNLEIPKDAHLIVHGKLKVLGNLTMSHNNAQFTMGDSAYVIIDGNFTAQNQVIISVSSFLIVQGNFTKSGSTTQGDLIVEGGNIYIFGTVDNWGGTDFTTCGDYQGDTGEIDEETCDYGTEDDFEDNYEDIPQDLIDLINCFDLSQLSDVETCVGTSAVFSVKANDSATFRWQLQNADGSWSDIAGLNLPNFKIAGPIITIENTTPALSGSKIRVVASATPTSLKPCTVSISRSVELLVKNDFTWTGSNSNLWSDPLNWSCKVLPTSSSDVLVPVSAVYPLIDAVTVGEAKNLSLDPLAQLEVTGTLKISGNLNGTINARNGSLEFNGSLSQTVPSNAFLPARVRNLSINNPSGVTLQSSLALSGILRLEQGDFKTNGHLTLISDANGTALVSGAGTGKISGMLTIQRYLNPAYGYKYFSSPFKGTIVEDFEPFMELKDPTTSFPHFYSYQGDRTDGSGNDLSGWKAYTNPSNPINYLEGYALNFGSAGGAVTISLSGEVNNGPLTRTLSSHDGTFTGGFHLVGNPYPSPIDWNNEAAWTKDNINDAVYFFRASSTDPYTGTYSSYVENGPSTDGKTSSIIPSMQGFFVHVSDGTTQGTLGITNAARVENFSQEFHKSSQGKRVHLIRINAGFEGEEILDPTVIYFHYKASESFDNQLDAYKLMNTHPDVPSFYSLTPKNEELSINAIASSLHKGHVRIPLGYRALRSGNLKLQLQDLDLPSGAYIYLVDLEKELYLDLSEKIVYSTPVGKGSSNSRFEIVLSDNAISNPDLLLNIPMSVYGNKEKLTVTLNLEKEGPSEITLSTLSGQVLKSITTSSRKVEIEGIRSAGVYIISLKSGEIHYTKKILIK